MRYLFMIVFLLLFLMVQAQYLRTDGKIIRDEKGEVILRGMGLGGWMLQEPYMLKLSDVAIAQYDIRNKISALVGENNTRKFYEAWLSNHCTKADIDSLAAWGFNSVRLPMHYNLFTLPVEQEPVKGKNTWLEKGFTLTDSLLSWCRENKIYLILDLHAAPGGQGNDRAIADRDSSKLSLWQSGDNKQKTIALWQKLAVRYATEKWIGGYDLINEPNIGFDDAADKNGCSEKTNAPLKALLQDITKAIRTVDKNHIIFIEGNCWANNYNGMFPLWDNNIVISFHKYWNYTDVSSIRKFLEYRETYKVPLWMGETGENSNAWFTNVISLLEKNKIGWAMWPLKKSGLNNPLQVKISPGMQKIIDYWKGSGPRPAENEAFQGLMQFAENSHITNNIAHMGVVDAMIRQVKSIEPVPFRKNIVGDDTIIYASDYDLGRSGVAYHDKDSAEYWVSTNKRTPWNIGGHYRNDGVDIEICRDSISNGFNVGWIDTGEWLQYSLYLPHHTEYDVNIRAASKENPGRLRLWLNNGFVSGSISLPATGNTQAWQTSTIRNIKLLKGWNRLRVVATGSGFNLNYLQFVPAGNTAKKNR